MLEHGSDAEAPLLKGVCPNEPDTVEPDTETGCMQRHGDGLDPVFGHTASEDGADTTTSKGWFTRRRVILLSTLLITAIMVPLLFLSIIPSEVAKECKHTKVEILEAHVSNPTDDGFDSAVTMRFTKGSAIPATIHMHDTYIKWSGEGGGKMVKLTRSNKLHATTNNQLLKSRAIINNVSAFTAFNQYAVDAAEVLWEMQGDATVFAMVEDVEVHLDKTVKMNGYNSFSIPPVIQDVNVTGGSSTALFSMSRTVITSQSNMALYFGQDLSFIIKSKGITIGIGTIPNATLSTGEFTSVSYVSMMSSTQEEYDELMSVLSRFMMGQPSDVTMQNFYLSKPVSWLVPGLDSISMSSSLPGVNGALVKQINMYVSLLHLINVPFDLLLYNAVDSEVTLQTVDCEIIFEDKHIADVHEDNIGLVIPAKTTVTTPEFSARTDLKHASALTDLLKEGFGLLDLYCTMATYVGDFPVSAVYNQMQVPAYLEET